MLSRDLTAVSPTRALDRVTTRESDISPFTITDTEDRDLFNKIFSRAYYAVPLIGPHILRSTID